MIKRNAKTAAKRKEERDILYRKKKSIWKIIKGKKTTTRTRKRRERERETVEDHKVPGPLTRVQR